MRNFAGTSATLTEPRSSRKMCQERDLVHQYPRHLGYLPNKRRRSANWEGRVGPGAEDRAFLWSGMHAHPIEIT